MICVEKCFKYPEPWRKMRKYFLFYVRIRKYFLKLYFQVSGNNQYICLLNNATQLCVVVNKSELYSII